MSRHAAVSVRRAGTASRRLRAILAGGLVLGVGAGITLAAWSDGEYAKADFTAGVFGIVGSTDGATYSEHTAAVPAPLTFSPAVGAMVPGTVSYSLFSVKTIPSSVAGTVQITSDAANAATGTLGQYLRYEVRTIAGTSCTSTTFTAGTTISIPALSTLAVSPGVAQTIGANGATVNYCFRFELPSSTDNDAQGKTLLAKWTFAATNS